MTEIVKDDQEVRFFCDRKKFPFFYDEENNRVAIDRSKLRLPALHFPSIIVVDNLAFVKDKVVPSEDQDEVRYAHYKTTCKCPQPSRDPLCVDNLIVWND